MSDFRLLAIHAHPDDESSKGAATTARYAAEGNEVLVLTCTGGERGDVINPAMDRPGIKEKMGEVRREEMANAARALGVQHRWLGHVDSGLPDPVEGKTMEELLPEGCFALLGMTPLRRNTSRLSANFVHTSLLPMTKMVATRTQTT